MIAAKGGMMVRKRMQLVIRVPVRVKKEGRYWIASCPALDVHSQGGTKSKALENLREALELFLETCIEMGTLGEVLREAGLHVRHRGGEVPEPALDVPIKLAA